jgi:hypothetical protein
MADGFSMGGGGNVQVGTLWVATKVDLATGVAEMQKFTGQVQKTQKDTTTAMKDMVKVFLAVESAIYSMRQAWTIFYDAVKEQTEMNRVVVAAENMGVAVDGLRGKLDELGAEFMRNGQKEEAAFRGYRQLLQATHNRTEAERLLGIALRFSVQQGEEVGTVVNALTKGYEGQGTLLQRLLQLYGGGSKKEIKDFGAALASMTELGNGANRVMSQGESAVHNLETAWHRFTEQFGNTIAPNLSRVLNSLSLDLEHPLRLLALLFPAGMSFLHLLDSIAGKKPGAGSTAGSVYGPWADKYWDSNLWGNMVNQPNPPAAWPEPAGTGGKDKAATEP